MSRAAQVLAETIIQRREEVTGKRPQRMWVSEQFLKEMFFTFETFEGNNPETQEYMFIGTRIFPTSTLTEYDVLFTNPLTPAKRWDELRKQVEGLESDAALRDTPKDARKLIKVILDQVLQRMNTLENDGAEDL